MGYSTYVPITLDPGIALHWPMLYTTYVFLSPNWEQGQARGTGPFALVGLCPGLPCGSPGLAA